jgi:DNA-binding MarR family transcriptional regulator
MSRLYSEIRQARPYDRPEEELAVTLLRTGDVLHHRIGKALRGGDISPEQYNVLRILRGAPAGHPTLEISRRVISRCPNMTRLIDRLASRGLVRREVSVEDRRVAVVRITPAGQEALKRHDRAVAGVLSRLRTLSPARMKQAVRLLDSIRESLAEASPPEE